MSILIFLLLAVISCSRLDDILKGLNDPSNDQNAKNDLLQGLDADSSLPALKASAHIYFFGREWIQPNFAKSLVKYQEAYFQTQDDPEVLFMLGMMYSYGIAAPLDISKGIIFFNFAAKLGSLQALSALGYAYRYGIGVTKDCGLAKRLYYRAAKQVLQNLSPKDAVSVRRPVRLSLNLPESQKEAMEYYEYSAKTGDASAALLLAQLYYFGTDVMEPNMERAKHFFEEAAVSGSDAAYSFLGMMHYRGEGVEVDYTLAKEYFSYAAERNVASAINGLGLLYWHGHGVTKDLDTAEILFKRAAELRYAESHFNHAMVLLEQPAIFTADKVFQGILASSKAGYVLANTELVKRYLKADTSCSAAVNALRQVMEKGELLALSREAYRMYLAGKVDQALSRYIYLAAQGFEIANYNAAFILERSEQQKYSKRSLFFYSRAALLENAYARKKIADAYFKAGDVVAAASHYYLAAKSTTPSAEALFNLGYLFEYGVGLKRDLYSAIDMYNAALLSDKAAYIAVRLSLARCQWKLFWNSIVGSFTPRKVSKSKPAGLPSDKDKLWTMFWTLVLTCFIYWYMNYYQNRPVAPAQPPPPAAPEHDSPTLVMSDSSPEIAPTVGENILEKDRESEKDSVD